MVGDVRFGSQRMLEQQAVGRVHIGHPNARPLLLVTNGLLDRELSPVGEQSQHFHRQPSGGIGRQLWHCLGGERVGLTVTAGLLEQDGLQRGRAPADGTGGDGLLDVTVGVLEQHGALLFRHANRAAADAGNQLECLQQAGLGDVEVRDRIVGLRGERLVALRGNRRAIDWHGTGIGFADEHALPLLAVDRGLAAIESAVRGRERARMRRGRTEAIECIDQALAFGGGQRAAQRVGDQFNGERVLGLLHAGARLLGEVGIEAVRRLA